MYSVCLSRRHSFIIGTTKVTCVFLGFFLFVCLFVCLFHTIAFRKNENEDKKTRYLTSGGLILSGRSSGSSKQKGRKYMSR